MANSVFHGGKDRQIANSMMRALGGDEGYRQRIEIGPDGTVTTLRTKDGSPNVEVKRPVKQSETVVRGFVFKYPGGKYAIVASRFVVKTRKLAVDAIHNTYTVAPRTDEEPGAYSRIWRIDGQKFKADAQYPKDGPRAIPTIPGAPDLIPWYAGGMLTVGYARQGSAQGVTVVAPTGVELMTQLIPDATEYYDAFAIAPYVDASGVFRFEWSDLPYSSPGTVVHSVTKIQTGTLAIANKEARVTAIEIPDPPTTVESYTGGGFTVAGEGRGDKVWLYGAGTERSVATNWIGSWGEVRWGDEPENEEEHGPITSWIKRTESATDIERPTAYLVYRSESDYDLSHPSSIHSRNVTTTNTEARLVDSRGHKGVSAKQAVVATTDATTPQNAVRSLYYSADGTPYYKTTCLFGEDEKGYCAIPANTWAQSDTAVVINATSRDYLFRDVEEGISLWVDISFISNTVIDSLNGSAVTGSRHIFVEYTLDYRGLHYTFDGGDSDYAVRPEDLWHTASLGSTTLYPVECIPYSSQSTCPFIAYTTKAEEAAGVPPEIYLDILVDLYSPNNPGDRGGTQFIARNCLQWTSTGYSANILDLASSLGPTPIQFANGVLGPWAPLLNAADSNDFTENDHLEISRI